MLAMVALVPAATVTSLGAWPGAVVTWGAAGLLWNHLRPSQRRLSMILGALGLAGLGFAWWRGAPVPLARIAAQNNLILAMLAAVSFLRLVTQPVVSVEESERLPRGPAAALRTLLGVHLFGAVINLSAVVVIGDRLERAKAMEPRVGLLLSRGFTCAVFYSPFFGGTALALTLAHGARLPVLVAAGLPLAAAGLSFALWSLWREDGAGLREFRGYPTDFRSLGVPALLAASVLGAHLALPAVPVLTVIAWLATLVVAILLGARDGPVGAGRIMVTHARERLPEMRGELVLFLAAGLLASGLTGVSATFGNWLPFAHFDGNTASLVMLVSVLAAFAGLHPVITLTAAASMLAVLHPSPDLLAVMFVCSWGIGTAVSPMAVTHLTMQGRYGINAWYFPRRNMLYGTMMLVLASGMLHLVAAWTA